MASNPERGAYGRRKASPFTPTPTYYGLPSIKPSHYGWLIATYFFVGGIAGAAQVIATAADLAGGERDRAVVRDGRYLALFGALLSPALLILDLQNPRRWYNMLRIVRPTSPMSLGSWVLFLFGNASGAAALAQLAEDAGARRAGRTWGRRFGVPAAALGLAMTCYTGVLLGATSIPLWAGAARRLPMLFAASSASTAVAALSLALRARGVRRGPHARLERLGLLTSVAQLVLARATERNWERHGVAAPMQAPPIGPAYTGGALWAGTVLPLAIHLFQVLGGRRAGRLSLAAAMLTLAGGYAERAAIVFGGNRSAQRPRDYFAITQPDAPPTPAGARGGER